MAKYVAWVSPKDGTRRPPASALIAEIVGGSRSLDSEAKHKRTGLRDCFSFSFCRHDAGSSTATGRSKRAASSDLQRPSARRTPRRPGRGGGGGGGGRMTDRRLTGGSQWSGESDMRRWGGSCSNNGSDW